jgi:hypothetical protein
MSSSGHKKSKRRKPAQHLPKVGTPEERKWEAKEARHDVTHAMGGPGQGAGSKIVYWLIGAIVVIGLVMAIIALIALD